jgi:site-specific recombinase XerD
MLRHACGFKLANDGVDTRSLQAYLGHRNIQNTTAKRRWRWIASKAFGAIEKSAFDPAVAR